MKTIHVIAAGPGWILVDKPCGISTHNEPGHDLTSIIAGMMERDKALREKTAFGRNAVVGPVHRLDRETSGLILLGFDRDVQRWFSRQFEDRTVEKVYTALVHGSPDCPEGGKIVWDNPLTHEAGGRRNPEGTGRKVPCSTTVRVMERSPHYALIECVLHTGRKHQIRRHAKLAGHPVLGDTRYNSSKAVNYVKTHCDFDRLGLHATSLRLVLPGENGPRRFLVPCPDDFLRVMALDREF